MSKTFLFNLLNGWWINWQLTTTESNTTTIITFDMRWHLNGKVMWVIWTVYNLHSCWCHWKIDQNSNWYLQFTIGCFIKVKVEVSIFNVECVEKDWRLIEFDALQSKVVELMKCNQWMILFILYLIW